MTTSETLVIASAQLLYNTKDQLSETITLEQSRQFDQLIKELIMETPIKLM